MAALHEFFPGGEVDSLVVDELGDFGVGEGLEVSEAGLVGAGDEGEFVGGAGGVEDDHGDAGFEGFEEFDELFGFLGGGPIAGGGVEVIDDGESGVPDYGDVGFELFGDFAVFDLDIGALAAGHEDRDLFLDAEADVFFEEGGVGKEGAHVGVEVGDGEAHAFGAGVLGADFEVDFFRGGVGDDFFDAGPEAALGVGETGDLAGTGKGTPAVGFPFGGQREVKAAIDVGVILEVGGDFWDPGAGHHDTPRGGDTLGDGFD